MWNPQNTEIQVFFVKSELSYHLFLNHTWSQTFDKLNKKFQQNSDLAISEKISDVRTLIL